jgi:hypothetical protein
VQVKTVLCGVWLAVPPRATVPRVGPRPAAPRPAPLPLLLPLAASLRSGHRSLTQEEKTQGPTELRNRQRATRSLVRNPKLLMCSSYSLHLVCTRSALAWVPTVDTMLTCCAQRLGAVLQLPLPASSSLLQLWRRQAAALGALVHDLPRLPLRLRPHAGVALLGGGVVTYRAEHAAAVD